MKLILDISIINESARHVHAMLRKVYKSGFVPPPDVDFEDGAWGEDLKRPSQVILSLEGYYCLLRFDDILLNSEEECKQAEGRHLAHGWRSPADWPL